MEIMKKYYAAKIILEKNAKKYVNHLPLQIKFQEDLNHMSEWQIILRNYIQT